MCGFAGSTAATPDVLAAMSERLAHRGPDDEDTWLEAEGGAGLAFRRLAVLDLSLRGRQPMASPDGRHVLVFNGEIYNHRELRRALEADGERFHSDGDTEVLLRLLMRDGAAALHRVVGMFAFALWDGEARSWLLARDRLGIKPLVYAPLAGGGLAFASEIRALAAHPGIPLTLDREALSRYLACLYVPVPMTIHHGIRKLAPGHVLHWRAGETRIERYWRPHVHGTREPTLDEAVEELLPALRRAVAGRMVADVPLGCFLSGGIDSAVVAALMAQEARGVRPGGGGGRGLDRIRTFTMTFDEAAYDEREAAAGVADHLGARHTELAASPGLVDRLDDYVAGFGEPFGNPTAFLVLDLARKARQHVTVALAGDGGDEVFAGYPRYRGGLMARRYARVPRWLRRGVVAPMAGLIREDAGGRHRARRTREFLVHADRDPARTYAAWVEYFDPAERRALLGLDAPPTRPIADAYGDQPSDDPLDAMQGTDLETFLPGNLLAYGDAMTMRHALELRLPLIDHRVVETVQTLAPGLRFQAGLKTLLRAVARRLLPADVVERPKRGFNPPMGVWLKTDLKGMVEDRLTAESMIACGLEWRPIERLLAEHRRGRRDHALKIWSLIALDAWRRSVHPA